MFRKELDLIIDNLEIEAQDVESPHVVWLDFVIRFTLMIETALHGRLTFCLFRDMDRVRAYGASFSAIRDFAQQCKDRIDQQQRLKGTQDTPPQEGATTSGSGVTV